MSAPKYEKPKDKLEVEFNLPDRVVVPSNTLGVITYTDGDEDVARKLIEPLKGKKKRDWFLDHAYFCLPLSIGNQHGFIVKAETDFTAIWNGGEEPFDVTVKLPEEYKGKQRIEAHFGMGTITIQNPWTFRTPRGVNLLIMNPPNMFVDGLIHMTACVETDQLRRDFTFNLKITRKDYLVQVKKGDPIGYVLPYPRHFVDQYKLLINEEAFPRDVIEDERLTSMLFGEERAKIDFNYAGGVGGRYMRGEDIYGNKLPDHQKSLDDYESQPKSEETLPKKEVRKCPFAPFFKSSEPPQTGEKKD